MYVYVIGYTCLRLSNLNNIQPTYSLALRKELPLMDDWAR